MDVPIVVIRLAGLGLLAVVAHPLFQALRARRWVRTPAQVISAAPARIPNVPPSEAWRVEGVLGYAVAGRSYTTSELYFRWCERRFWSTEDAEEEIAARWTLGATITAFVDPTAPGRAVAVRRIHPRILLAVAIGLLLVLVPAAG